MVLSINGCYLLVQSHQCVALRLYYDRYVTVIHCALINVAPTRKVLVKFKTRTPADVRASSRCVEKLLCQFSEYITSLEL